MTHLSVCSLFHTLLSFIRQMAFRLVARDSPSIYRSFIYSLRFFIGDFFFLFFPLFFLAALVLFGFVCFPDRHWGVLERVVLFISSKIGYFLASLPYLFIQYLLGLGPVVRIGQGKVSVGCFFGPFFLEPLLSGEFGSIFAKIPNRAKSSLALLFFCFYVEMTGYDSR